MPLVILIIFVTVGINNFLHNLKRTKMSVE